MKKTGIDDELKNINKIDSYRLKDREKNPNESRTHSKGVVVPINRFQKRSKNNDKSPKTGYSFSDVCLNKECQPDGPMKMVSLSFLVSHRILFLIAR